MKLNLCIFLSVVILFSSVKAFSFEGRIERIGKKEEIIIRDRDGIVHTVEKSEIDSQLYKKMQVGKKVLFDVCPNDFGAGLCRIKVINSGTNNSRPENKKIRYEPAPQGEAVSE